MARLTQADLADLNHTFEERTPQELIQWAHSVFGDRLAALSSMQKNGSLVCHMLKELQLPVPVLFVDTEVLFQETLTTRDRFVEEYGLNVVTLKPELTMEQQTDKYGVLYLTPEGQEKCCHMRKTEPLLKAKGQYDAMLGSLRRGDGGNRERTPILAIDTEMNCVRVNVLVNFTDQQVEKYIAENAVIINPLHFQGFSTIGCNRCTTPVLKDEPKRAGRWRHLGPWAVYCGINPTDRLTGDAAPAVDLPQDLIDRLLGRETDYMI